MIGASPADNSELQSSRIAAMQRAFPRVNRRMSELAAVPAYCSFLPFPFANDKLRRMAVLTRLSLCPGARVAQTVDIEIEVAVGERTLIRSGQPEGERPRETRQGKDNVSFGEIAWERSVPGGTCNQFLHECLGARAKVGPLPVVKERVDDVDGTDAVIKHYVHVLAEDVDPLRTDFDQGLASADTMLEHVADGGVQQRLLVWKVPVERTDADPARAAIASTTRRGPASTNKVSDRECDWRYRYLR